MDSEEQKLRYLLSRGRISSNDCAHALTLLDKYSAEALYWKTVAEKALNENNELRAEVARLNQIARY